MKEYEIVCSHDAIGVDYSETVLANEEPSFWECYSIAEAHGCDWFYVTELAPEPGYC